jgi:hypothetical protein
MAMNNTAAIVIGGAQNVWRELEDAQRLCREAEVSCEYFVTNDMISRFSKQCIALTLHVDKLPAWLADRSANGFIPPLTVWICEKETKKPAALFATHTTTDWGGSVGLFATKVAIQEYYMDKVILCGVPMKRDAGHFVRGRPWDDVLTFERRWEKYIPWLKNFVRSMSGRTQEWLGEPTKEWLLSDVAGGLVK